MFTRLAPLNKMAPADFYEFMLVNKSTIQEESSFLSHSCTTLFKINGTVVASRIVSNRGTYYYGK